MNEEENFDEVRRWIRLKRFEQPHEDYYDDFLLEFKERQRTDMMQQSAWRVGVDRVSASLWGVGNRRWVYAAGAAYAALMMFAFLRSGDDDLRSVDREAAAESDVVNVSVERALDDDGKPVPLESGGLKDEKTKSEGSTSFLREF